MLPESLNVLDNIYWGGDFELLKNLVITNKIEPHEIKFFLGYSGWAPEQLLNEIEEKFWIVSDIDSGIIMKKNSNIWKELLNKKGDSYALWANSPTNPGMN